MQIRSGAYAKCALFTVATVFFLSACGGGSDGNSDSGSNSDNDTELLVNAGPDDTVTEGATYSLSAEVTGGDGEYTYNWTASPSLTLTHDDTSSSEASFTAPAVSVDTEYTLTVSVNDTSGNTDSDFTIITVSPVNIAPVAAISVPE